MVGVDRIRVIAGAGLEDDRYATGRGAFDRPRGPTNHVTLIEVEAIEAVSHEYGITLEPGESRRNITTRGVALNHLVGAEFQIGAARLRGLKLCEPCGYLEKHTGIEGVRKSLIHRGGLRAEVVAEGEISVGDEVRPVE